MLYYMDSMTPRGFLLGFLPAKLLQRLLMSWHFYKRDILFRRKSSTMMFFLKKDTAIYKTVGSFLIQTLQFVQIVEPTLHCIFTDDYFAMKRKPWLFLYLEKELPLCVLLRHYIGRHGAVTHCRLALLSIKAGDQWEELACTKLFTNLTNSSPN